MPDNDKNINIGIFMSLISHYRTEKVFGDLIIFQNFSGIIRKIFNDIFMQSFHRDYLFILYGVFFAANSL
ncbi:hypothetical protein JW964_29090 [candidate division KSB1 bacterium]|nr:hypothetical protein [candidate division KSB1 bacterium]